MTDAETPKDPDEKPETVSGETLQEAVTGLIDVLREHVDVDRVIFYVASQGQQVTQVSGFVGAWEVEATLEEAKTWVRDSAARAHLVEQARHRSRHPSNLHWKPNTLGGLN